LRGRIHRRLQLGWPRTTGCPAKKIIGRSSAADNLRLVWAHPGTAHFASISGIFEVAPAITRINRCCRSAQRVQIFLRTKEKAAGQCHNRGCVGEPRRLPLADLSHNSRLGPNLPTDFHRSICETDRPFLRRGNRGSEANRRHLTDAEVKGTKTRHRIFCDARSTAPRSSSSSRKRIRATRWRPAVSLCRELGVRRILKHSCKSLIG
jgi:hypothetical protein